MIGSFLFVQNMALANNVDDKVVRIRLHTERGEDIASFIPFENYVGKISVTSGDIDGNGRDEIIVGGGFGMVPKIRIFNNEGELMREFGAYSYFARQGVNVASCDLSGDGKAEIITGTMEGGGPHVRVFNGEGELMSQFFAYNNDFEGGVMVECGKVKNDGNNFIITSPGITGGPHVRVFDMRGELQDEFFAGDISDDRGLQTRVINDNGKYLLAVTQKADGEHSILIYEYRNGFRLIEVIELGEKENLQLSSFRYKDENKDNVLISHGYDQSTVKALNEGNIRFEFSNFAGNHGSQVETMNGDGHRLQISVSDSGIHRNKSGQHIVVSLDKQRLWSFEDGKMVHNFLISSGRRGAETPLGKTEVTHKLPVHTYRWSYGPNDPRNYVIPNVQWNLRFRRHYYIHSATWHNNFGQPMSAGCVNVAPVDAEAIYHWAEVGASVEIVK